MLHTFITFWDHSKKIYMLVLNIAIKKIICETINKLNLIKLENFYIVKETIYKMKRQPSEWEEVFANKASDKGFIPEIHNQFMELNLKKKKKNNIIKKMGRRPK